MEQRSGRTAWLWVPTLYFAEGLPYFIVNTIALIMFKDMGMDNGTLALLTSLISLPWTVKPLWSPFVDIFRSKRWWIVTMQALMAVSVALVALLMPRPSAEEIAAGAVPVSAFSMTIIFFMIAAFASATHDISADGYYMIALDNRRQSAFVGIRNTFYRIAMVFGQGVLVVVAGLLERRLGKVPEAWSLTLVLTSSLLAAVTVYHAFMLPKPEEDRPVAHRTASDIFKGFGQAFATFFTKKGVWLAITFMLLFRLPEAFSVKMLYPFFSDAAAAGGLGFDKAAYGIVYGTAGVIALLAGGILGGLDISRRGLRRCIFTMAMSLALPCAVYLFMAMVQPSSLVLVGACVVLDQFGYGYGFTAYTVYMMRFSDGPMKTSHYAICTGFMALSMLLPGAVAGYLQEWLGYVGFFSLVMICCLVTIFVSLSVRRRLS